MSTHSELLLHNLGWLSASAETRVLTWERDWMADLVRHVRQQASPIGTVALLHSALEELVYGQPPSPASQWLAHEMSREQLQMLMSEYAIDGLTEAIAMFAIIPRLQGTAQSAVMRVLIDEFGCGNPQRVHSELFRKLLHELALPDDLQVYLGTVNEESLAFVNLYHYLTKRAPHVDWYLGALAYTEMVIPVSFAGFATACQRLGIRHRAYFTEHIHIDAYHTHDALLALEAMAAAGRLTVQAAWEGALMAQSVGESAFVAAVRKAGGRA
jgi:hypothetical protein